MADMTNIVVICGGRGSHISPLSDKYGFVNDVIMKLQIGAKSFMVEKE